MGKKLKKLAKVATAAGAAYLGSKYLKGKGYKNVHETGAITKTPGGKWGPGVGGKQHVSKGKNLFSEIKSNFNEVQLHSLSPPEIDYLARKEGISVEEVLRRLRSAGLDSLPGGGAELLTEKVRKIISPNKISAERWIEVMEEAHNLGMKTTATMMFGHVEEEEDIIEHLFRIRDLQKKTAGFTAFIPWTFQPERTELHSIVKERVPPLRYLQVLAISRVVLYNIGNIQASWLTQGFDIAKLALFFGANDFGGTMLEENVVSATGKMIKPARVEDIVKAAKSVNRKVAQRRTDYKIIKYY